MALYFVSDMHLDEQKPESFQAFFSFLEAKKDDIDALYLLGDLFEYWIGDDYVEPLSEQFIQQLILLANAGKPCFIQHGNRDFLIGKKFLRRSMATLLPDLYSLKFAGKQIVLCHGDQLCTLDKEYQRSRKLLRNPLTKFIMRHLPLSKRLKVVEKARLYSKTYNKNQDSEILDVTEDSVISLLNQFSADILIHGHTHKPGLYTLPQGQKRYVLGSWGADGGQILRLTETSIDLIPSQ